jgi:hypothetical protein
VLPIARQPVSYPRSFGTLGAPPAERLRIFLVSA